MKILKMALPILVLFIGSSLAFGDSTNLVQNGGFESDDFTGWTHGGNTGGTHVDGYYFHSGSYSAALGPSGSDGSLSQVLTTVAGQQYTITFYLAVGPDLGNDFSAYFGGNTLFSQTDIAFQGFTLYTYAVTTASSSTTLEFDFRDGPSYLFLDDVSVTAGTPEPSSIILLGSGLLGLAGAARRKLGMSA